MNGSTMVEEEVRVVSSSSNPAGLAKQKPMDKIPPITCHTLETPSPIVSPVVSLGEGQAVVAVF